MRPWLRAQHSLGVLRRPICGISSSGDRSVEHRSADAAAVAIVLLFLRLGVLSVAAWVGLWPPTPQKLIRRWRHRRTWRQPCFAGVACLPSLHGRAGDRDRALPRRADHLHYRDQGYPPKQLNNAGPASWARSSQWQLSLIDLCVCPRWSPPTRCRATTGSTGTSEPDHG